ncbi:MAG: lysylphosphatidylglycerol synthase transmembrane domain-containing protein [Ferruginibacter sp.]
MASAKTFIQLILFLGGGIFLIWWQLHNMSTSELQVFKESLQHINYLYIIPVACMSILSHISRSMRWQLIMEPMGYKPSLLNTYLVTMAGYLANSAIPRLGEVLKCTMLARYEKLRADRLLGTIILERAFDLCCFLIFIGLTLLLQLDKIGRVLWGKFQQKDEAASWLWPLLVYALVVVVLIFGIRLLFKKFPDVKPIAVVSRFFTGLGEGIRSVKNMKNRGQFLAHTVFIWSMYLGQIYIGFFAMEATTGLPPATAFSVLTLATVSMILTPGGIGSFPLFVGETLTFYGISLAVGVAFGWVMWGVSTALVIIVGLLAFIALPFVNRKNDLLTDDANVIENNR